MPHGSVSKTAGVLTLTDGVTDEGSTAGHSGDPRRSRTKRTSRPSRSTLSVPARTNIPFRSTTFSGGVTDAQLAVISEFPGCRSPSRAGEASRARRRRYRAGPCGGRAWRRRGPPPRRSRSAPGTPNGSRSPLTHQRRHVGGQFGGPARLRLARRVQRERQAQDAGGPQPGGRAAGDPRAAGSAADQISGRPAGTIGPAPPSTPRRAARPGPGRGDRPPGRAG